MGHALNLKPVKEFPLRERSHSTPSLLLPVIMLGSTLRCLLFAGLCLSDPHSFAEDQVIFEAKGSPVLRRFNVASPAQLEKTLVKAQVHVPRSGYIGYTHHILRLRTMDSTSGKLPQHTSISTSLQTQLHHPSSYPSRISRSPTLIPFKL